MFRTFTHSQAFFISLMSTTAPSIFLPLITLLHPTTITEASPSTGNLRMSHNYMINETASFDLGYILFHPDGQTPTVQMIRLDLFTRGRPFTLSLFLCEEDPSAPINDADPNRRWVGVRFDITFSPSHSSGASQANSGELTSEHSGDVRMTSQDNQR